MIILNIWKKKNNLNVPNHKPVLDDVVNPCGAFFSLMDPDWNDACPIANKNTSGILDLQSTLEKQHDSIMSTLD